MRKYPFPFVTIMTDQVGTMRNIVSIDEAAEWLVMRWPIEKGEKLLAAKIACMETMDGKVTCTVARDAFIAAAREAGIYVTHKRV